MDPNAKATIQLSSGARDVLRQLFLDGPTWDGNIISKLGRDELVMRGFADRHEGINFITADGVRVALGWGLDREKERRYRLRHTQFRLGSDDSGHDYVYPAMYAEEWEKWVNQLNGDDPDYETPDYAYRVEGGLTFTWPVEHGVAIVEQVKL